MPNLLTVFCLFALLMGAPPVWALDSKISLGDYHHDIWIGKDGAPGEVAAMAQTNDGWLWIASSNGLYRFDGVRFRRFEALPDEVFPNRPITALTALRNGDLLIGYIYGGMSLLSKGHVTNYPSMVDKRLLGPISSAVMGQDGVIWAAAPSNGLLRLKDGVWESVGQEMGLPHPRVSNIIIDQYEQMWLASGDQLLMLERGGQRFRTVLTGYNVVNLSASPDGRLWLDTHEELVPVPSQHRGPNLARPDWLARAEGQENGLFDRDGNYWMLGCPGVCRTDGVGVQPAEIRNPIANPSSKFDQPWQVSSLTGNILFEDRDGNIWVGTQAGVERFRNNRLTKVQLSGGERFYSFARDDSGKVLVLAKPTGELWQLNPDGTSKVLERGHQGPFGMLDNAAGGGILLAGPKHIERRRRGQVEIIDYPPDPSGKPGDVPAVRIMDDGRDLWVSIARRGTFRLHDGKWQTQLELGIPQGIFFAAPGTVGSMWFGYNDGVVVHFDDGQVKQYTPQGDQDVGAVTFLHGGADVVVAGNSGMAVFRDGVFKRLRAADPDVLTRVSGMIVSANGDRWFNGNKGVVYVRAADWKLALTAQNNPMKYILYGVLDGYPGFAATANRQPSAISDVHGQLWFAGVSGVARLDSGRNDPPPHAPHVIVETLAARGTRYTEFSKPVLLAPGTNSFRIEYTALSYTMPEALRFRYQLEGMDIEWQDPGSRRAISYSNLGPGNYRFRVSAVNQLGQWSDKEAAISVSILPSFTQTPFFYFLCVVAAIGLLYSLYLLRLRQATLRLAARMAERERIARALHDSFLQSVHGLTLSFEVALHAWPPDSAACQKIERVLLMADKVMEEGRNEVQDLRSGMGDGDLANGLTLIGEVLQDSYRAVFSLRTIGKPRKLEDRVATECYKIGREALMNAFRHADAAAIQVLLHYDSEQLSLQVIDDGKGIDQDIIHTGRAGHWGITGLFERTACIGGTLILEKIEAGGTRVLLTVPSSRAYIDQSRWWTQLPRWLSRDK